MIYIPKKHIWQVDKKSALGFMCINIYDIKVEGFDIINEIQNGLLNDNHFGKNIEANELTLQNYGSLDLTKIQEKDFLIVDSDNLEKLFNKLWSETDWGADLPIFKDYYSIANQYLESIEFKANKHFFLNKGWLEKDKIIEPDFFGYLTVVLSINDTEIGITTYGID